MKLLFDQNLSHRLADLLHSEFPDSTHFRNLGLARAADPMVWAHAASHNFLIASKDIDFQQRALLLGPPPKVVWIRLGNCRTTEVATLLRSHQTTLLAFEADPAASFIALG